MPHRPARPCSVPGCPNLVHKSGVYRCSEHQKEYERRVDAERGTPSQRGYDANWRRIRERFLSDHSKCKLCMNKATVAHHKIRRRKGGKDDPSNLMALCGSCHSRLHAQAGHNWNKDD